MDLALWLLQVLQGGSGGNGLPLLSLPENPNEVWSRTGLRDRWRSNELRSNEPVADDDAAAGSPIKIGSSSETSTASNSSTLSGAPNTESSESESLPADVASRGRSSAPGYTKPGCWTWVSLAVTAKYFPERQGTRPGGLLKMACERLSGDCRHKSSNFKCKLLRFKFADLPPLLARESAAKADAKPKRVDCCSGLNIQRRFQQYGREQQKGSDGKTRRCETKAGLSHTYVLYSLDADLLAFFPFLPTCWPSRLADLLALKS